MPRERQPDAVPDSGSRRTLWLTKAALLVIGLGLCAVGKRVGGWPIVTWPMYSRLTPKFPAPHVSAVELRVIESGGDHRTVVPLDLFPADRVVIAERLFEHAFDESNQPLRDVDRAYLEALIRRRLPDLDAKTIEGWRLHWKVTPLSLPPLDRGNPTRETLGSFTASVPKGAAVP